MRTTLKTFTVALLAQYLSANATQPSELHASTRGDLSCKDDVTSLIQVSRPMTKPRASLEESDACKCLVWKDAYHSCNSTSELCNGFYARAADAWCVNGWFGQLPPKYPGPSDEGSQEPTQMCLVSSACKNLNGGAPVNADVSTKVCKSGVDELMRDKTPTELLVWARKMDMDYGEVIYLAYRTSTIPWTDVRAFYTNGKISQSQLKQPILSAKGSNKPMVFPNAPFSPIGWGVIQGPIAYAMHPNKTYFDTPHAQPDIFLRHGLTQCVTVSCVGKCSLDGIVPP